MTSLLNFHAFAATRGERLRHGRNEIAERTDNRKEAPILKATITFRDGG
jgi:hypothetical protein